MSYWKEDKTLNIIGSFSLIIISIILVGTSVQSTDLMPSSITYISNVTNYTYTEISYSPVLYNQGTFYENLGIGVMLVIFTAIQYLYFSVAYKFAAGREVSE
jgi:hypothetical protein